jgi:hypothetical protein
MGRDQRRQISRQSINHYIVQALAIAAQILRGFEMTQPAKVGKRVMYKTTLQGQGDEQFAAVPM